MAAKCPWFTTHETAEFLGITDSGARWLADTGQVQSIRTVGGRRLLSAADVERLRRNRTRTKIRVGIRCNVGRMAYQKAAGPVP